MKAKTIIAISVTLLLANSCRKDEPMHGGAYPSQTSGPFRTCIDDRFANANDSEDENMMNQIIMLTYGVRSFGNNAELLNIIYNKCDAAANYEVTYADLIAEDSDFKTLLNNHLRPIYFSGEAGNYDCYTDIDNEMTHQSIDYYPNIYIPNIKTADLEEWPYICIGAAEINTGDSIVAYRMYANGTFSEVLLGESQALALENPVIIINNGTEYVEEDGGEDNYEEFATDPEEPEPTEARNYQWESWKIKSGYRYENVGNSDVWSHHTFYDGAFGNYLQNLSYASGIYKNKITEVSASDVNSSVLHQYMTNPMLPSNLTSTQATQYVYMHITTFEYDWYASTKLVQYCTTYGSPRVHSPRMKFSNEWYHNTICDINHYIWLPGVNYVFGFGNIKSYFKIKRVV